MCSTNACASPQFDQLWLLILTHDATPPTLIELRYGDTPRRHGMSTSSLASDTAIAADVRVTGGALVVEFSD